MSNYITSEMMFLNLYKNCLQATYLLPAEISLHFTQFRTTDTMTDIYVIAC